MAQIMVAKRAHGQSYILVERESDLDHLGQLPATLDAAPKDILHADRTEGERKGETNYRSREMASARADCTPTDHYAIKRNYTLFLLRLVMV